MIKMYTFEQKTYFAMWTKGVYNTGEDSDREGSVVSNTFVPFDGAYGGGEFGMRFL